MSPSICLYRFGNYFHRAGLMRFSRCISYLNRFLFSLWLPSSCEIGRNFKIGYWGLGVVIHSNTKIGSRVTIAQNVTIGRNFGDRGVPVIGDDVYIGAGSVVFGNILIGDNVIIGANSTVNKTVPSNCTVVGNPFRIIMSNRTLRYYELD